MAEKKIQGRNESRIPINSSLDETLLGETLRDLDRLIEKNNFYKENYNKKILENSWRISLPDQKKILVPRQGTQTREQVLKYLDSVFIDDALKDDIVTRTAIPDLLNGSEPGYNGVILFGPPGTGKTVLLKAIGEVYEASGAYAREISTSSVNSMWVGQFAKNLEAEIQQALNEAKQRRKPSFLYFDEGSILAQKAEEGASSVSKHYQEAIDVLKRYLGNERNLVIAISTNQLLESFEEALTREGRMTTFFIGYPDVEQRKRMWKHFAEKYNVLILDDKQAYKLAEATPAEQGAFIEEFARNYRRARRTAILREKGYSSLVEALKHNAGTSEEEITSSIGFDNLYADLSTTLEAKYQRLREGEKGNGHKIVGFRSLE